MADTVKALLYVCLAFVGISKTITSFFINALLFPMKRQSVYHVSLYNNTPHPNATVHQTSSFETSGHNKTIVVDLATAGGYNDGKDTGSLTHNLSFSEFERPEQLGKATRHRSGEDCDDIKKGTAETLNQSEKIEQVQTLDDISDSMDKDSLARR